MELVIRILEPADIHRGFLETLSALSPPGLTPDEAEALLHDPLRANTTTWVALADGRVAGTVSLVLERKFTHRGGLVGHIEDVAVHPEFRHGRVGSRLVAHATKEAVRLGCYKVVLNCHDAVQSFYCRLGFRQHDYGMRLDVEPKR